MTMSNTEVPLPRYSRDPETISIRSAAPSYISNAPSYHSQHITAEQEESRSQGRACREDRHAILNPYARSAGNISWSSVQGHQSRAYLSVANRRAARPQLSTVPDSRSPPCSTARTSPSDNPAPSAEARRGRDEEALQEENKSWEFMLSQMADWDAREREWRKFKAEVEERKKKGARLGWIGLGKGIWG